MTGFPQLDHAFQAIALAAVSEVAAISFDSLLLKASRKLSQSSLRFLTITIGTPGSANLPKCRFFRSRFFIICRI